MKLILGLCALILAAGAFFAWRARQLPASFGTFSGASAAEVSELIAKPKTFAGKTVAVQGTITQQCKTMGCFFYFVAGEQTLRVDLEAIAMNAPMREGHRARVEGQMMPYGDGYQLFASAIEFQ
jgi:hypothetical protein